MTRDSSGRLPTGPTGVGSNVQYTNATRRIPPQERRCGNRPLAIDGPVADGHTGAHSPASSTSASADGVEMIGVQGLEGVSTAAIGTP